MKVTIKVRLFSLALVAFFMYSFIGIDLVPAFYSESAPSFEKSASVNPISSSFPFEESEDSDSLERSKEDVAKVHPSTFLNNLINENLLSGLVEKELTHITYTIGSPLYLAHRTFLI
jgi:hypothetical protein